MDRLLDHKIDYFENDGLWRDESIFRIRAVVMENGSKLLSVNIFLFWRAKGSSEGWMDYRLSTPYTKVIIVIEYKFNSSAQYGSWTPMDLRSSEQSSLFAAAVVYQETWASGTNVHQGG